MLEPNRKIWRFFREKKIFQKFGYQKNKKTHILATLKNTLATRKKEKNPDRYH
jgi:hypothetical protein